RLRKRLGVLRRKRQPVGIAHRTCPRNMREGLFDLWRCLSYRLQKIPLTNCAKYPSSVWNTCNFLAQLARSLHQQPVIRSPFLSHMLEKIQPVDQGHLPALIPLPEKAKVLFPRPRRQTLNIATLRTARLLPAWRLVSLPLCPALAIGAQPTSPAGAVWSRAV